MITPAEMIAMRALDRLVGVSPGIGRLALLLVGPFAEHLDEAAQGERRQDILRLAPPQAEERRPEADRELLDLHAVPLGQEEVAQLVDEDDEAQAQGDLGDIEHDNSGFPTINLPSGPGVDVPERVERGPRIKRMMIKGGATDPGDVEKADFPLQEPRDRRLVGGVERRPGRPSSPHHLVS